MIFFHYMKHLMARWWQGRGVSWQMLTLFTLVMVLGSYLLPEATASHSLMLLWLGHMLVAFIAPEWWFLEDMDNGSLEIIHTRPNATAAWLAARWLGFALLLLLPVSVLAMIANQLMGWSSHHGELAISLLAVSLSHSALACLSASMTIAVRQQGGLGYCLVMPIAIPAMIFGMIASNQGDVSAVKALIAYVCALTPMSFILSLVLLRHAIRQQS